MARSLLLLALCGLAASFTTSRNALSVAPVRQTASAAPEMKFRVCDMTGKRRNAKAMTVTFSHTRNHKVGLLTPHRAPDGRRRRPRLERGAGNGRSRPFGDALRPAAALRPRRRRARPRPRRPTRSPRDAARSPRRRSLGPEGEPPGSPPLVVRGQQIRPDARVDEGAEDDREVRPRQDGQEVRRRPQRVRAVSSEPPPLPPRRRVVARAACLLPL